MSIKQQFHAAVEALPDSVSVEEAFERLYQAFKLKQAHERRGLDDPTVLLRALQQGEADIASGRVKPHDDVIAKYQAFVDGEP
jgi:predicted transcriptional regulator